MLGATQSGFLEATDAADYLVKKGLSFREAHEIIGQLVSHCTEKDIRLANIELTVLQDFSNLFAKDFFQAIDLNQIINSRNSTGSSGSEPLKQQISSFKMLLKEQNTAEMQSAFDLSKNSLLI